MSLTNYWHPDLMQIGCILESWLSWRHVCSLPRCRCPWAKSLDGCQGRSLGLWQSLHHEHDWHYAIFCPFSFNIFNSLSFSVVPRYLRYLVTADLCPFARFACWALQRSHQRHWRTWCFQAVWTMCKAYSLIFLHMFSGLLLSRDIGHIHFTKVLWGHSLASFGCFMLLL